MSSDEPTYVWYLRESERLHSRHREERDRVLAESARHREDIRNMPAAGRTLGEVLAAAQERLRDEANRELDRVDAVAHEERARLDAEHRRRSDKEREEELRCPLGDLP